VLQALRGWMPCPTKSFKAPKKSQSSDPDEEKSATASSFLDPRQMPEGKVAVFHLSNSSIVMC